MTWLIPQKLPTGSLNQQPGLSRAPGCNCGGTGRLGADLQRPCPCTRENATDELDRVKAENTQLREHVATLEKMLAELRTDRDLVQAAYDRLQGYIAKFAAEAGHA